MSYTFPVPAPEERIIVATLQRMYRHFYFRICDIVNSGALVEQREAEEPREARGQGRFVHAGDKLAQAPARV